MEQIKHSPGDELLKDCYPVLMEREACGNTKPLASPALSMAVPDLTGHGATASGNLPAPQFVTILLHLSQRSVIATLYICPDYVLCIVSEMCGNGLKKKVEVDGYKDGHCCEDWKIGSARELLMSSMLSWIL